MEESILLSSDSNPSPPPLFFEGDQDLDIPKAKLSDICGDRNSGGGLLERTSTRVYNTEPIASTSTYIPPSTVSDVVPIDSESDVKADFTWSAATWKYEYRPSTSGTTKIVDAVTDSNVHQLSDSDTGLSDFLSDSENEPFTTREDDVDSKNSPINTTREDGVYSKNSPINDLGDGVNLKNSPINDLRQTNDNEERPKWASLLDEDTEPPSSGSSSTLPPDRVPYTLYPSISSCSSIPHQPSDTFLSSSESTSTLPPDAAQSASPSKVTKFEKTPSFHDISDSEGGSSDTFEAAPTKIPGSFGSGEIKPSYHNYISLSEDEPENPSSVSSSTLPPPRCDKSAELLAVHSEPILSNSCTISESQLGTNSQPLTSTSSQPLTSRKRPRSNVIDVFESKRLRELKTKEKSERAAVAERVRRMKPGECMKYVTVILDQNIVSDYPWAPAVVEILQQAGIKHSIEVATDPCTVKWMREQADTSVPQQEKHVLFLWSTEKLLISVQFGILGETFAEFKKKYKNFKLYLCVHGLHNYYRKFHRAKQRQNKSADPPQRQRKSNYEITPDQLEMELIALQIKYGISHKILNSPQDTAYFLQLITKSVAEMPFKLEKEKMEMERNWYAKGDSKKCARIDKDFNGLRQLWLQQLSQFNLSSLDIAKSIAELYPTPLTLYHAYRQCSTLKEKENMLQDIVVKRGPGGGGRRLGPELSRKISIMFCQDEDVPLG